MTAVAVLKPGTRVRLNTEQTRGAWAHGRLGKIVGPVGPLVRSGDGQTLTDHGLTYVEVDGLREEQHDGTWLSAGPAARVPACDEGTCSHGYFPATLDEIEEIA